MRIRSRMSTSIDGYVTTPSGWPALTADPAFVSGQSHGIQEFLADCEAALMGRVTFEPALNNDRWPWPDLDVFVLTSERTEGTPDHVVTDSDPQRLLDRMREADNGGDVQRRCGTDVRELARAGRRLDRDRLLVRGQPRRVAGSTGEPALSLYRPWGRRITARAHAVPHARHRPSAASPHLHAAAGARDPAPPRGRDA